MTASCCCARLVIAFPCCATHRFLRCSRMSSASSRGAVDIDFCCHCIPCHVCLSFHFLVHSGASMLCATLRLYTLNDQLTNVFKPIVSSLAAKLGFGPLEPGSRSDIHTLFDVQILKPALARPERENCIKEGSHPALGVRMSIALLVGCLCLVPDFGPIVVCLCQT